MKSSSACRPLGSSAISVQFSPGGPSARMAASWAGGGARRGVDGETIARPRQSRVALAPRSTSVPVGACKPSCGLPAVRTLLLPALAISLAIAAAQHGRRVYYGSLADLLPDNDSPLRAPPPDVGHIRPLLAGHSSSVVDSLAIKPGRWGPDNTGGAGGVRRQACGLFSRRCQRYRGRAVRRAGRYAGVHLAVRAGGGSCLRPRWAAGSTFPTAWRSTRHGRSSARWKDLRPGCRVRRHSPGPSGSG
jgi:hypothetical protein